MTSSASNDGFQVVTPVLSKVTSLQNGHAVSKVSVPADLAKEGYAEGSTEEGASERTAEKQTEDATDEKATEGMTGSLSGGNTIEFNGARYVEASDPGATCLMYRLTINDISYVPENVYKEYKKTAYTLYQEHAEDQEASQEESTHASSRFRGQPIMVYVGAGSQSYSVHTSILTKSPVLGQMPLDEAEDGSYSLKIPDEDPIRFERLLNYLYQGTWESHLINNCGGCWRDSVTGHCTCWNNKKYMQLYASACEYGLYGLTAQIALKLDLKEGILAFCEAFRCAYEKCPGNSQVRDLFRRNLLVIFENNVRQEVLWEHSSATVSQVAQMASCGGDFAIDLTKTLATAQESAVLSKMYSELDSQEPTGWGDNWGNNNVNYSGDHGDPADNLGWGMTAREDTVGKDSGWGRERPSSPAPATSVIRQDVDILQDKVRSLENTVKDLQLNVEKVARSQQAGFSKMPYGNAPGYLPAGYLPFLPPTSTWDTLRDGQGWY